MNWNDKLLLYTSNSDSDIHITTWTQCHNYYAEYFGYKLHIDQNEKLIRFWVTHVAASDDYSGKLLGIISMPVKNYFTIYDELSR